MAKYDANSIEVLEGLEGVRSKPAFYLGVDPQDRGLYQLAKEIVDNACDEAINGHSKVVGIAFDGDWVYVWDNGRGIPVEVHPKFKKEKTSTLEIIFTKLHAGGKLNAKQSGYKAARGTHGVGSAVVNALTSTLEVFSYRNNKWHSMSFSRGLATSKIKSGITPPKIPGYKFKNKSGTLVRYKADKDIFKKAVLNLKDIAAWFDLQAYVHGGIKFITIIKGKQVEYYQPKGMAAYISKTCEALKVEPLGKPFMLKDGCLDVILQWTSHTDELVTSYVNGSPTSGGGTHVLGMNAAIQKALSPFATKKTSNFRSEDLRSGMIGVINYSTKSPQFDSQGKSKYVGKSAEQKVEIDENLFKALKSFFDKHKSLAKEIIARACEIREANAAFTMSKKAATELKSTRNGRKFISAKFAGSTTKDPTKRELFLVEGDSAGGSSKKARDSSFQEILPLRGKIINAYGSKANKLLESEEILAVLRAIGYDPTAKDPGKHLRVGKVITLCDPDVDGLHITNLVMSLLQKTMSFLFTELKVYTVDAKLFTFQHGGKFYFGDSVENIKKQLPKVNVVGVTRIKGYGEINPDVLKKIAFEKGSRKLVRVMPLTNKELKRFISVVGETPEIRKQLLGIEGPVE